MLIGKTQPTDTSLAHFDVTFSGNGSKSENDGTEPDLIVINLHMPEEDLPASMEANSLPDGPTILAISLGNDDAAEALAESIGAVKLLDKIDLVEELVPAILRLAPASKPSLSSWGQVDR